MNKALEMHNIAQQNCRKVYYENAIQEIERLAKEGKFCTTLNIKESKSSKEVVDFLIKAFKDDGFEVKHEQDIGYHTLTIEW